MGIKEFIKPTKGKIILTIILIAIAFGLWFLGIASIPMGGYIPFYAPILLFFLTFGIFRFNPFVEGINIIHVLFVIIVYYLLSCLIISIFRRKKR